MASHFVSLNRGLQGIVKSSDFNTGTSSTATDLFEFRILDGVTPTKLEVQQAIEAIENFFHNAQLVSAAGFDVKG